MKCKLLESQIYVSTTGQYRMCCVSAESNNVENVATHLPQQWLESKTVTDAKTLLANNVWPDACRRCQDEEIAGITSRRIAKDFYGPGITHLDLRLGNSCNLKCISCWPGSSSSLAEESVEMVSKGIVPIYQAGTITTNWYDENYLDHFKDMPLQEVYLTGGEPTMVKHLPAFLEKLDSNVAIRFNTNATLHNPQLLKLLKRFNSVKVSISIDAIGTRNEYIRYGSRWADIENNVKDYLDACTVDINPCISVLNAIYYDEVLEWASQLNIPVIDNLLITPGWLHIKNAPAQLKAQMTYFEAWKNTSADPLQQEIFRNNILKLDSFRNNKIRDFLPEVAAAYGL